MFAGAKARRDRVLKTLKRAWSRRQLARLGLLRHFEDYPTEAIKPKYHELYGLYRLAMERKPRVLLELGGGYSTFVFAQACRDLAARGYRTQFYSVDQSAHWQGIVQSHLPDELCDFVEFHRSEVVEKELNGSPARGFATLPVDSANFIFLDGGGNCDPVLLERNAPNDYAILVDGRKSTVEFLRKNLRLHYQVGTGPAGTQTLFQRR